MNGWKNCKTARVIKYNLEKINKAGYSEKADHNKYDSSKFQKLIMIKDVMVVMVYRLLMRINEM